MNGPQLQFLTPSESGEFWLPETPTIRSRGTLRLDGTTFRVDVDSLIVPSLCVTAKRTGSAFTNVGSKILIQASWEPRKVAADRTPRTLHGRLDNGAPITLIGAQMYTDVGICETRLRTNKAGSWRPMIRQTFKSFRLFRGAHTSPSDKAMGVRWTLAIANPAGWLTPGTLSISDGLISSWVYRDFPGFEIQLDNPSSLLEVAEKLPQRMGTLLKLGLGKDVPIAHRELSLPSGVWCTFETPEAFNPVSESDLIGPSGFNLQHFASWADGSRELGRYPTVAMEEVRPVEIAAQVYMTAMEGLDRSLAKKLEQEGSPIPPRILKKARAAAVAAATKVFSDQSLPGVNPSALRRQYRQSLSHIGEPTYAERVRRLVVPIYAFVPELFGGDLDRWIQFAVKIRNQESHGSVSASDLELDAIYHYLTMFRSARWAMRLRLLLTIFDPETLLRYLKASNAFHYILATADVDAIWGDYSASDNFLHAGPHVRSNRQGGAFN